MTSMKDRVVVITGGSTGIGLATAQQLVQEGARVVLFARSAEALEEAKRKLGEAARCVTGDVREEADLARLFKSVAVTERRLDGLFINAGIAEFQPLELCDIEHYTRVFDTNVKGALFTLKQALPLLGNGSSVVFNTSVASTIGAPLCSVYGASKGAVAAFARSAAAELLSSGVRVNMVAPGPTETPIQGKAAIDAQGLERIAPYLMQRMRMGRLGRAEEIAATVSFLLSPRASFIVGQELAVDGGLTGL